MRKKIISIYELINGKSDFGVHYGTHRTVAIISMVKSGKLNPETIVGIVGNQNSPISLSAGTLVNLYDKGLLHTHQVKNHSLNAPWFSGAKAARIIDDFDEKKLFDPNRDDGVGVWLLREPDNVNERRFSRGLFSTIRNDSNVGNGQLVGDFIAEKIKENVSFVPQGNDEKAVREIVNAISKKPEIMNKHLYIRGVAPKEAFDAIQGVNGRVADEVALTNRGDDKERLAFGMNENGEKGISEKLMNEFFLDLQYYASLGAYSEKYSGRDLSPKLRGYFLIFATEKPLENHAIQINYGSSWRSTSELPEGIEENLVAVFPAAQSTGPSSVGEYAESDKIVFISGDAEYDLEKVKSFFRQ